MSATTTTSTAPDSLAVTSNRVVYWFSRNWILWASVLWGLYVGLPWLAPVFMKFGWTAAGQFIYLRDTWSGMVWSPTYQPTCREPDAYDVTFDLDKF